MIIKTFKGGYDKNFAYLLHYQDKAILVDPSVKSQKIFNYCQEKKLTLTAVIVMHSHSDHLVDLDSYREKEITIIAHKSSPIKSNLQVVEGNNINIGQIKLTVMHTPGHRFDCICLLSKNNLFTSDTLFVRGCGRVDFPGSDPLKMVETLERIKRLPGNIKIYPGHDYGPLPTSTISEEKRLNNFLNMNKAEFLKNRLG